MGRVEAVGEVGVLGGEVLEGGVMGEVEVSGLLLVHLHLTPTAL